MFNWLISLFEYSIGIWTYKNQLNHRNITKTTKLSSFLLVSVIVNGTILYLIAQIPNWYLSCSPSLNLSSTPSLSITNNSCSYEHFSSFLIQTPAFQLASHFLIFPLRIRSPHCNQNALSILQIRLHLPWFSLFTGISFKVKPNFHTRPSKNLSVCTLLTSPAWSSVTATPSFLFLSSTLLKLYWTFPN